MKAWRYFYTFLFALPIQALKRDQKWRCHLLFSSSLDVLWIGAKMKKEKIFWRGLVDNAVNNCWEREREREREREKPTKMPDCHLFFVKQRCTQPHWKASEKNLSRKPRNWKTARKKERKWRWMNAEIVSIQIISGRREREKERNCFNTFSFFKPEAFFRSGRY